jgi:hypothetical protein
LDLVGRRCSSIRTHVSERDDHTPEAVPIS